MVEMLTSLYYYKEVFVICIALFIIFASAYMVAVLWDRFMK